MEKKYYFAMFCLFIACLGFLSLRFSFVDARQISPSQPVLSSLIDKESEKSKILDPDSSSLTVTPTPTTNKIVPVSRIACHNPRCRMLHISTPHPGVLAEMEALAEQLDVDLDWNCTNCHLTPDDPGISRELADKLWVDRVFDWCKTYDIILVSDTISLSRPLLQHNCSASRIILRITNRYDWSEWSDTHYQNLLRDVWMKDNVRIIPNNYLEAIYALVIENVFLKVDAVIPGLGILPKKQISDLENPDRCREKDPKEDGIYMVLSHYDSDFLAPKLAELNISYIPKYYRSYCGPAGLRNYLLIHVPYQASTMALFENLGQGVVYALPSLRLMTEILTQTPWNTAAWPKSIQEFNYLPYTDWYWEGYREIFIYFDSYEELRTLPFQRFLIEKKRRLVHEFMELHRKISVPLWKRLIFEQSLTTSGVARTNLSEIEKSTSISQVEK